MYFIFTKDKYLLLSTYRLYNIITYISYVMRYKTFSARITIQTFYVFFFFFDRFLLKALDLFWHEDCLMCGCCGCRLGEVGSTLYTKANMILCKKDYFRYLLADTSHTVWCYYWLTGFTGCLAIRACARLASRTYQRSRWSWGPVATCITWSVLRANSVITGNKPQ